MLLKFAIQDYIEDREYYNLAEQTIVNIEMHLRLFSDYCIEQGVSNLEDVNTLVVKQYIKSKAKNDAPATTNTRILRLRAFFNYCVTNEYIPKNPASVVKKIKEDNKVEVFTDAQIKQMLNHYKQMNTRRRNSQSYRNYMLIVFLISTGFRRSEVINLKWEHVDMRENTIQVLSKNRKLQTVSITSKLSKELRAYKQYLVSHFNHLENIEYVFVSHKGEQLKIYTIDWIFKELKKNMNFKDVRVSCHTFRHTFCHRLVKSNLSTFAIMRMMRHDNIIVTQRYVNFWNTEMKEINEKYNPLNQFNI